MNDNDSHFRTRLARKGHYEAILVAEFAESLRRLKKLTNSIWAPGGVVFALHLLKLFPSCDVIVLLYSILITHVMVYCSTPSDYKSSFIEYVLMLFKTPAMSRKAAKAKAKGKVPSALKRLLYGPDHFMQRTLNWFSTFEVFVWTVIFDIRCTFCAQVY